MSSFFDSLNFHRDSHRPSDDPSGSTSHHSSSSARTASHGSSGRADSSSAVADSSLGPLTGRTALHALRSSRPENISARRGETISATATAPRASDVASAMNGDAHDETASRDEGPRVFWDVPPSTFIRDWAKANPPDQADTRRAAEMEGKDGGSWRDDAWTDRLLRSAAATDGSAAPSRGGKWSRQASTASTTSTTSNSTSRTNSTSAGTTGGVGPLRALKGRSSTINRRSKSLRNAKTAAGFRRHVSTSAVLDESNAGNSNSHPSALAALCGGAGENQAERVNKLLADLGLAFQAESGRGPDYEDEEGGDTLADVSMDSMHTICDPGFSIEADRATPGRSKEATPAHTSSGKTLTAGSTPQPPLTLTASQRILSAGGKGGLPTSSWERTLTFPPSGSPAAGGPQFRTGEAMPVVTDIDAESEDEDGFWDEALLADLPLLSGIEEDHEGYFSGEATKALAVSSPHPAPSTSPRSATAAASLGKRRDPPTPSPDEVLRTSVAEEPTGGMSAPSTQSRSPSPTKMQRWNRASSRGAKGVSPDSAPQPPAAANGYSLDAAHAVEPALKVRTRSAAAAAAAAVKDSALPRTAALPKPQLRKSTAGPMRQPGRASSSPSPSRSTNTTTKPTTTVAPTTASAATTPATSTSSARRAASPATFYGASPSTTRAAGTSARSVSSTGMTTSRPAGLSRRSAGMSSSLSAGSGMTLLRGAGGGSAGAGAAGRQGSAESAGAGAGASEKVKAGFKMPSRRALPVVPPLEASSTRVGGGGGGGAGAGTEDDSFGELEGIDAADLDLEEIERVMSANGY